MVPKGAETEAVAQVMQSMAAEAGFDMKIRVTEFATSLKQAEAGEYQAFMLAWSGRIDPDGNSYVFLQTDAPQNYSALVQSRSRQGARRRAAGHRSGAAQGDLRKADQDRARRRADHLHLSPQDPDRAYHQARRLQADAGRAGARGRAEAEVSSGSPGTRADAMLNFLGKRIAAADPDAVLRVGADLLAAASAAGRSGAGHGRRGARSRRHRADPPAIPARSADPGAIRLLGQGRAVRRFRRVAAHQGAGARADRAETAGDDAARRRWRS